MAEFNSSIIGLITDFGVKGSHYVASMKEIILKINPDVKIIDISHNVTPFSVIEASFILKTVYKTFPSGTIFIIVVDPGVGSLRDILVIKTKTDYVFIGPNNGIFSNIFKDNDILECVRIQNSKYYNKPTSNTFHGRDIMSPVGAYITKGLDLNNFGPSFDPKNLVIYPLEYEISPKRKKIRCVIQYIDNFGNGTTNISLLEEKIKGTSISLEEGKIIKFKLNNNEYQGKFFSHFGVVPKNTLLFVKGSTGFLEISVNQGNAAKQIGFKVGDIISFSL